MLRFYCSGCLLSLLLLAACSAKPKGGDEVGPARTVFIDQGTGAENTEPLWPIVVGSRREHRAGVVAVPEHTRMFGRELYRFQGSSTVRFYEKTSEGVFSAGSIILGALPREVLLVPTKVKVGMKWQSFETSDSPSITSVVKSAEMKDTIFGPRRVWTIDQTDEVSKATYSTAFAEGRGPILVDGDAATLSIVPLDPEPTLATNARLTVTPLGSAPLFKDFWATTMSATVDASGKATIRAGGITTWYDNLIGVGIWDLATQTVCATTTDGKSLAAGDPWVDTGPPSKSTNPTCPEASGSLFANGVLQQIEVNADGSQAGQTGLHLKTDGTPESFAVGVNPSGLPILGMGNNGQMYGVKARVYGGEITATWQHSAGPFQRILVESTAPSDDFGFAAMFGDRVMGATVKGRKITPMELVASVPGAHLSTKTTASGREHYLVTTDGVVDRMHIGADGTVTLERYAELNLPAQHELVGVVPFADHLLVLAVRGRGDAPQQHSVEKQVLGDVFAFSAPLPPAPVDASRPMAPRNAITAEPLGYDLKICWPKGAGPAVTTGWKLGGQPVTAIVSGASDDCVVLLRDRSIVVSGEGAYAAEGSIPGVGKVAIGLHTPENYVDYDLPYGDPSQLAPLSSGGFTSVGVRYGNGADVIGIPDTPAPVSQAREGTADAAGHGVWWANGGATTHLCLHVNPAAVLIGLTSLCIDAPFPGIAGIPVAGGGVIWEGNLGTTPIWMKLDGTSTPIPALAADAVIAAATADGTVCGLSGTTGSRKVFCNTAGSMRTAPISEVQAGGFSGPWTPAGDVFYALASAVSISRINPSTLAIDPVDGSALTPGGYLQPRYSSDGKLYGAYHVNGEVHVYAVEGTTLMAADPEGWAGVASMVKDVVITRDVVVGLTGLVEPYRFLRFPRR